MAKVKVVTLDQRDPYHRGLAHGEECREGIKIVLAAWRNHLHRRFFSVGGWARYLLIPRVYDFLFRNHIPAPFLEEMRGVARGANCRLDEIVFINCFDDAFRILLQRGQPHRPEKVQKLWEEWNAKMMGCSSVAARTLQGTYLAGSNLDEGILEKELCRLVTVFRYASDGEHPAFVSVLIPGYIGVLRGMNDYGIHLSHHAVTTTDARKPGIPQGLLLRQALMQDTVQNVAKVIANVPRRTIGGNIMIGNAYHTRILECSATLWAERSSDDSLVCTNHFLNGYMQGQYRSEYAVPGFSAAEFLVDPSYTKWRMKHLEELVAITPVSEPADVCGMLAQVSNTMTVQTVIYDPVARQVYVAVPRSGFPPAPQNCDLVCIGV